MNQSVYIKRNSITFTHKDQFTYHGEYYSACEKSFIFSSAALEALYQFLRKCHQRCHQGYVGLVLETINMESQHRVGLTKDALYEIWDPVVFF